ncbi:hypothetical protein Y032_0018g3722 [Ancylostoma ceylanicum]|uniref:Uncharacterized protein n=1 Tax=Ancylostoma ceylanicum TaxID=53326 RepID=A0A016V544_9BILA|nr:hypothetical protein Y032_0018g3722 [Ancylostoma ceylanicum]
MGISCLMPNESALRYGLLAQGVPMGGLCLQLQPYWYRPSDWLVPPIFQTGGMIPSIQMFHYCFRENQPTCRPIRLRS